VTINSLKELDKLMLLCKKRGIKAIKIDNIEFAIEDMVSSIAPKASNKLPYTAPDLITGSFDPGTISVNDKIDMPDELTQEQLLFYSAQNMTEDPDESYSKTRVSVSNTN
jgi:actin-like ATPase involved in cell morphogenesis